MAGPHGSAEATETRAALRRRVIAERRLQKSEVIADWSLALGTRLRELFPQAPGKVVGFCWPVQNEPDVRPVVLAWQQAGARLCLPVVRQVAAPLDFVEWTPETPMQADPYGIPAPVSGAVLLPDVLLIPLNAFDAAGFRIGYGGGFFDRTIAALQPRPLCIGVGFEIGRVASVQPEPHDQRLDWIVTEAQTARCS